MQKIAVFQKNRIAMLLAVMLMFCAFAAGNDNADRVVRLSDAKPESAVSLWMGTGEFFTDSLPQAEAHSVREATVQWQELIGSVGQGGRLQRGRTPGGRLSHLWITFAAIAMQQLALSLGRADLKKEKAVHHSNEIIVCYIHNKDGQKD